jgi:hypothetical protein
MTGEWVPIILFVVIGLVVVGYFYWNHRNRADVMKTVQTAIEKGGELNADLLTQLGAAVNPRVRDLRRGIIFIALGIAGMLCGVLLDVPEAVNGIIAGSMFPLLLGAGFLLVWKLNRD